MLRDAWIIFTKEFKNVFKERRAIFANYILPLLLMPLIFTGIEYFTSRQITDAQEQIHAVYLVNSPDEFEAVLGRYLTYQEVGEGYTRDTLTVVFPAGYRPGDRASVEVWADSTSTSMGIAADQISAALNEYTGAIASGILARVGVDPADLQSIAIRRVDTAPEEAQGTNFLAMMLPYILLIFLFAGSMAMGMNITAGEKERGGLTGLLVNQVSRSSIALGKIFFLIASALISSATSTAGLLIAFRMSPGFFGGEALIGEAAILQPAGIAALLLTVLSAGSVSASIIVFLGSVAKNMKEASGYITPIYIIVVMAGVVTMSLDATSNLALFLIPFANIIFMLKGIITSSYTAIQLVLTIGVNLVVLGLMVWLTSRLYNSERIMNSV